MLYDANEPRCQAESRGKIAIVTGAGSGMGRAGGHCLPLKEPTVVVADIHEQNGQRVVENIREAGGRAEFLPLDVRRSESVEGLERETLARNGRIDVLYHNAVDVKFVNEQDRRATELPDEVWDRMIDWCSAGLSDAASILGATWSSASPDLEDHFDRDG